MLTSSVPTRHIKSVEPTRGISESHVKGVQVQHLTNHSDMRGNLSVAEYGQALPFIPQRVFMVYGVPSIEIRGEHAHKTLEQYLICTHGSVTVLVDDGFQQEEYVLSDPTVGVYVPPMVWALQYKFSADAVLLVLASDKYDAADYIRDYDEFVHLVTT